MSNVLKEEDLYQPIRNFFMNNGYTIRSEVRDCDITATKEDELIIVEMKKNLTVKLLTQAIKRQQLTENVYIAIPKPRPFRLKGKWTDIFRLVKKLGLGLIFVDMKEKHFFVEIAIEPKSADEFKSMRINKRKRQGLVKEIEGRNKDLNVGGSTGRKLMTAYREQAVFIACCLRRLEHMSPKALKKLGTDDKKTNSILYQNHYGWFERIEKGVYKLSQKGDKELEQYEELVAFYNEKINEKIGSVDSK